MSCAGDAVKTRQNQGEIMTNKTCGCLFQPNLALSLQQVPRLMRQWRLDTRDFTHVLWFSADGRGKNKKNLKAKQVVVL